MAYKRISAMDIYQILSRWHSGYNNTEISAALNLDRKTVRHYIRLAEQAGLCRNQALPPKPQLLKRFHSFIPARTHAQPARETFSPYRDEIVAMVTASVDPVKPKTAYEIICERYDVTASYSSFKRFIRPHLERATVQTTCRFETDPGEEIQIDYGKMGRLFDPLLGRNRDLYAFIGALSYSRFKFSEFSYKQDQRNFVASHIRMFEFFGGVPKRLVIDNLKAGVLKADLYLPRLNRTYQELADHYGCFVDPARPHHPKDKGKVERIVPLVREQFRKLKRLHPNLDIATANRELRFWCRQTDGLRVHGSTGLKPLEVFQEVEKHVLAPLPVHHFQIATWKKARVHVDQYIQFEKAFYSVPSQYVGCEVWVRAAEKLVELYDCDNHTLIKKHLRAPKGRQTDPRDFPENFRLMLEEQPIQTLLGRAAVIGTHFRQLILGVLSPHAKLNYRRALALVNLGKKYYPEQLDEAARLALKYNIYTPKQFERLLKNNNTDAQESIFISDETRQLVRDPTYFIK